MLCRTILNPASSRINRAESKAMTTNAEYGQDACMNCGWDDGAEKPKSEVSFVAGDAVCPECGELCDYFDFRDE